MNMKKQYHSSHTEVLTISSRGLMIPTSPPLDPGMAPIRE